MDMTLKCIICKRDSGSGINILGKAICSECEETLVNIDVYDDSYDKYKDLIKRNIYGDIILNSK